MEKGLNSYIREEFNLKEVDIRTYSPLALAYIGDGVFDLIVRSVVVARGNAKANELHAKTSHIVKANTQARMIDVLLPHLTKEEESVYKRGRNAHSATTAKNATVSDYRKATGLEALIGYLYLKDEWDRIFFLIKEGLTELNERI